MTTAKPETATERESLHRRAERFRKHLQVVQTRQADRSASPYYREVGDGKVELDSVSLRTDAYALARGYTQITYELQLLQTRLDVLRTQHGPEVAFDAFRGILTSILMEGDEG
jgi:hypothetical protein